MKKVCVRTKISFPPETGRVIAKFFRIGGIALDVQLGVITFVTIRKIKFPPRP